MKGADTGGWRGVSNVFILKSGESTDIITYGTGNSSLTLDVAKVMNRETKSSDKIIKWRCVAEGDEIMN